MFRGHADECFVAFVEGVPIRTIDGVSIDYVTADCEHLVRALSEPRMSQGVPILGVEPLMLLKLRANRRQDRIDVGALVNETGVSEADVAGYLRQHEPELLPRLRRALDEWTTKTDERHRHAGFGPSLGANTDQSSKKMSATKATFSPMRL